MHVYTVISIQCPLLSHVQLFVTLRTSLPGFSVHGILQARILEWVAISFSRVSPQPRDRTRSPALQADSFPCKPSGKNASAGSCKRRGFNFQVRKIPWRRASKSTPVFLPRDPHGQRSLAGYSNRVANHQILLK